LEYVNLFVYHSKFHSHPCGGFRFSTSIAHDNLSIWLVVIIPFAYQLLGTDQVIDFALGTNGMLRFRGRLCIPADDELKRMILEKGYKSHLSLHPGMTKMY